MIKRIPVGDYYKYFGFILMDESKVDFADLAETEALLKCNIEALRKSVLFKSDDKEELERVISFVESAGLNLAPKILEYEVDNFDPRNTTVYIKIGFYVGGDDTGTAKWNGRIEGKYVLPKCEVFTF